MLGYQFHIHSWPSYTRFRISSYRVVLASESLFSDFASISLIDLGTTHYYMVLSSAMDCTAVLQLCGENQTLVNLGGRPFYDDGIN